MSDIIVYDLEIYKYDWFITARFISNNKYIQIHNDIESIQKFYEENKNNIWAGHNSCHYDNILLKCMIKGVDCPQLKSISNDIIEKDLGKNIIRKYNLNSIQLFSFDVMQYRIKYGLKEVEGYLGMSIEETEIPFDLDRPLTDEEIKLVFKYNKHDVDATTEEVYLRMGFFESKVLLLKKYDLPLSMLDYSDQQLCAEILNSDYKKFDDGLKPFDKSIIPLEINKYKECEKFFTDIDKLDYSRELKINISDVPHILSNGGIHGAIDNYFYEGEMWLIDVSSYYPNLMINFNLCSRAMSSPENFKNLVKTRMDAKELKSELKLKYDNSNDENEKRELKEKISEISKENDALKLPINITSGAMKAKFSKLFDERNNNWMCISGQLLLVDLIESLEPYCKLIQSNTDGIIIIPKNKKICDEKIKYWEDKTGLILEKTIAKKLFQKDVNNYILLDNDDNIKTKGGFVGQFDNDNRYKIMIRRNLEIIDDAVVNYLLYNINIEDSIKNPELPLLKFQIIKKLGGMYDDIVLYKYDNNKNLIIERNNINRINRIFATNDSHYGKLMKKKNTKIKFDSVEGCPDKCYVLNSDIRELKSKDIDLDYDWYISQTKNRIIDFVLSDYEKNKLFKSYSTDDLFLVVEAKLNRV